MSNSPSLMSKLVFGCTTVIAIGASSSEAMTKAYDCFNRTTGQLTAQSAVDISSVTLQCVNNLNSEDLYAESSSPESEEAETEYSTIDEEDNDSEYRYEEDEEQYEDESSAYHDYSDDDYESDESTGQQLRKAAGRHIGELFGNMLNDIMGQSNQF